jgi:hypothetical protein
VLKSGVQAGDKAVLRLEAVFHTAEEKALCNNLSSLCVYPVSGCSHSSPQYPLFTDE